MVGEGQAGTMQGYRKEGWMLPCSCYLLRLVFSLDGCKCSAVVTLTFSLPHERAMLVALPSASWPLHEELPLSAVFFLLILVCLYPSCNSDLSLNFFSKKSPTATYLVILCYTILFSLPTES